MKNFLCPYPWIIPCLTTSGSFRVCPVSQSSESKGLVKNDDGPLPTLRNTTEAHKALNSDSLKDLRLRMMKGDDVSDTCRRCLFEESQNITSLRQKEMHRFPQFTADFVKQWTLEDGSLKQDTPLSMVIFRGGNKCNLACRMCGPSSSSTWYKEWYDTRHKGFRADDERVALSLNGNSLTPTPDLYSWSEGEEALKFIESCGDDLEMLHFTGGEPLLSRGHLPILKRLIETGRAGKITLQYNTNLTVFPEEILKLWEEFKFVEVGISVDGPPQVNEYIRYPARTDKLVSNLHKLDRSSIKGHFWISTTVQIYNLFYLDELEQWLHEQKFSRITSEISWHILRGPKELSIFALPKKTKDLAAERLQHSPTFKSIASTLFHNDDSESFPEFLRTTKKMDEYRKQSLENLTELWSAL